jgi:hypothetical protein
MGCMATLVILSLCPCNINFSGYFGSPSPIVPTLPPPVLAPAPPPHFSHIMESFSCLFYFSSSITCFFNFTKDVHFFSRMSFIACPLPLLLAPWLMCASSAKCSAALLKLFLIRYSRIAWLSSSFYLVVNPTILVQHLIIKAFLRIQTIICTCIDLMGFWGFGVHRDSVPMPLQYKLLWLFR